MNLLAGGSQPVRGPQHDLDAGTSRQGDPEEGVENRRHLDVGQAKGLVQQDHSGLSLGADLGGGGSQGVGGLQGVPPLNALAATTATADVDVELADQGTSRDFRLILCGNLCFPDGATAPRARVRQGCLQDLIDSCGAGGQAVAVAPVGRAGFAAGHLGLWLGRPLGEGCGLAFGLALSLVEAGAGPFEFALEAFVLLAKAFVLLAKAFVLLAELLDFGAGVAATPQGRRRARIPGRTP